MVAGPSARSWPAEAKYDRTREVWVVEIVDSGLAPALSFSVERGGYFVPVEVRDRHPTVTARRLEDILQGTGSL